MESPVHENSPERFSERRIFRKVGMQLRIDPRDDNVRNFLVSQDFKGFLVTGKRRILQNIITIARASSLLAARCNTRKGGARTIRGQRNLALTVAIRRLGRGRVPRVPRRFSVAY